MSNLLDKQLVLSLNANWMAMGYRTVRQSITSLTGGDLTPPAMALDVTMDEEGKMLSAIPTKWDDWIKLPVRACDLSISTKNGAIRCPTIMVSTNFSKMPLKTPKLSNRAILERDGYKCAYTGEKLLKSQLSVDHVVPKARGGANDWGNMVACRKDINSNKGSKMNSEAGLTLRIKPKKPMALPACATISEAKRPEQAPFLKN